MATKQTERTTFSGSLLCVVFAYDQNEFIYNDFQDLKEKMFSQDINIPEFANIDKSFYADYFLNIDMFDGLDLLSVSETSIDFEDSVIEETNGKKDGIMVVLEAPIEISNGLAVIMKENLFKPFAAEYSKLNPTRQIEFHSVIVDKIYKKTLTSIIK